LGRVHFRVPPDLTQSATEHDGKEVDDPQEQRPSAPRQKHEPQEPAANSLCKIAATRRRPPLGRCVIHRLERAKNHLRASVVITAGQDANAPPERAAPKRVGG